MSVVLSIEDAGPSRKRLAVEVPGAAVEAEMLRVVEEFRRKARLPGFRPGRAPASLVRQRYREDIRQEVIDRLVPRYWKQAAEETQVEPLMPPQVEQIELQAGQPLTFVATVDVRPQIRLGDLSGFELPEMGVEPRAEEVEEALDELHRRRGTRTAVARAAARGDEVAAELIEFDANDEAGPARSLHVEVGDPAVWEELSLALTGLAAGHEAEFTRREGSQERRYRARVAEVRQLELPPLDDARAQEIGGVASLAALRERIGAELRRARVHQRRERRERALLDQLRARQPLELPEGLVEQEVEELVRDFAEGLLRRGVDLEHAGIDWAAVRREARPQAERRVHARLLLDAIADRDGVEVSEDEFERAVASLARAQGTTTVAVRQALDRGGRLGGLRRQLRRDKVLGALLGEEAAPVVAGNG